MNCPFRKKEKSIKEIEKAILNPKTKIISCFSKSEFEVPSENIVASPKIDKIIAGKKSK